MMQQSTLYIKGMVCNRCVTVVKSTLRELGYQNAEVILGEASISNQEEKINSDALEDSLAVYGFSLVKSDKERVVKQLKELVAEVYAAEYDFPERFRFSNLVKSRFGREYETVRDIFIASEKKSVEQFIIDFRINKVKELLLYSTLPLADIAFKLNFTSVPHLSTQFKQQTGLTASYFRSIKSKKSDLIFSVN